MYIRAVSVRRRFPQNWLFLPQPATVGHMNGDGGHMADTFGARLQAARKRAGIKSQEALGDLVGVSGKTIRNYETNKTRPDAATIDALRRHLGHFDAEGDAVEVAIANSELTDWRQDAVRSVYRKNLAEQREGRSA